MRTLVLGLALLAASCLAAAQTKYAIDLPAQPLADAIRAIGKKSETNILFDPAYTSGKTAQPLKGQLTTEEALEHVLSGTGLVAERVQERTLSIRPRSGAPGGVPQNPILLAQARNESAGASDVSATREKIEVTGSRIGRVEAQGSSPLVVIDGKDIERTGATSLQQVFQYLPQASQNNDASPILTSQSGSTTVRLRGLVASATLVLINGRRVAATGANFGFSTSFFDLNNIPLAAVERIEVLTDTASAVYGADAIAGVVNIILKKRDVGTSIDLRYGSARGGNPSDARATLTHGVDAGRLHGFLLVDTFQQDPMSSLDRERSANQDFRRFGAADRRSSVTRPGNVFSATAANLPGLSSTFAGIPPGTGAGLTPSSFAGTAGVLNLGGSVVDLVGEVKRDSALATLSYDFAPRLSLFGEVLYTKSHTDFNTGTYTLSRVTVPATNPFNPFGTAVRVDYAFSGTRQPTVTDTDFTRFLGGARGGLLDRFQWEVAYLVTDEKTHSDVLFGFNSTAVAAALAQTDPARALNLFGDRPTPSDIFDALVNPHSLRDYRARVNQVDGHVKGELFRLPGGYVEAVVGGEAREEKLEVSQPFTVFTAGSRKVKSVFAEALLPILDAPQNIPFARRLAFTAAVRRDDYDDFGASTNPQYGMKWTVTPDVLVRASAGNAFKAPTLFQVHAPPTQTLNLVAADPRRGETYPMPLLTGGNANVDPERGRSRSVGFVLSPTHMPGLSASVDYWKVEHENRIQVLSPLLVLANESLFPSFITRGAPTAADTAAGKPGRVTLLSATPLNFGLARLEGVDLSASFRWPAWNGNAQIAAAGTYVGKYDAALLPGSAPQNRAGVAVITDGFAPRFKGNIRFSWQNTRWEAGFGVRYVHSYQDYVVTGDTTPPRTIEPQTLVDVFASYTFRPALFFREGRLRLGASNVFDRDPPFSKGPSLFGYDAYMTDVIGRTVYAALNLRF